MSEDKFLAVSSSSSPPARVLPVLRVPKTTLRCTEGERPRAGHGRDQAGAATCPLPGLPLGQHFILPPTICDSTEGVLPTREAH